MLHTEAIALSQWSSFSGSNLLKTDLSVCEMGPSYLLDLSTVLKCTEVRVMMPITAVRRQSVYTQNPAQLFDTKVEPTMQQKDIYKVSFKGELHPFYTRPSWRYYSA